MSLALCLKAKICKKGKSIKNMEEGSRGRPWSAPNWAKMAKFIFSKKIRKRGKNCHGITLKNFTFIKIVNELVLPLERGGKGVAHGGHQTAKMGKKQKFHFRCKK